MLYLQESFVTINWDEATEAVVVEWKGFIQLEKAQKGLNKALELFIEKGAKGRWLGDNIQLLPFGQDTEKWFNEDWFPRALQAGLKNLALVVPKSVLTKMSLDSMLSQIPGTNLTMAYFDTQEAAKKWLLSR